MWVICDLALHMIKKRIVNLDTAVYEVEPQIPLTFFMPQNEAFQNNISYIPLGFHNPRSRSGSPSPQVSSTDQNDQINKVSLFDIFVHVSRLINYLHTVTPQARYDTIRLGGRKQE